MGETYLTNPIEFLVRAVLGFYVLILLLRFLLQLVHADFYNPLSQFLVRATQPLLKPLRSIVPGSTRVDGAALVALLAVQVASLATTLILRGGGFSPLALLPLGIAELLDLAINVFLISIIAQAILSWVNPGARNPAFGLLYSLNEPLLRPARRLLPPLSGIDLSPIAVLLGLQVAKMLLLPPLYGLAAALK